MGYSTLGVQSETKEAFKKLKFDLSEIIPEASLKGMSEDEVVLFLTHLFTKENIKKFIECKKTLLKSHPKYFDITYQQLLERVFDYYI